MKNIIIVIIILVISSCSTTNVEVVQEENIVLEDQSIDSKIGIYDKYNDMIPILIKELQQCGPTDGNNINTKYTDTVVEYGVFLDSNGFNDLETSTIKDEKYWKSILTLTVKDNTALYVRLFLLLREGYISRAELILLMCYYDQNKDWSRDKMVLDSVTRDINEITAASNSYIEEGIKKWDSGLREEALELYYKSLEIYPKNPWGIYELVFDYRTENPTVNLDNYFSLIRSIDPLYAHAYQGSMTPKLKLAGSTLLNEVNPAYKELWQGNDVIKNMTLLANGYMKMEEYENALYVYKYLLYHTFSDQFNQEIVDNINLCLKALNMESVIEYLDNYLNYIIELNHNKES